jgi:hypothetical protein
MFLITFHLKSFDQILEPSTMTGFPYFYWVSAVLIPVTRVWHLSLMLPILLIVNYLSSKLTWTLSVGGWDSKVRVFWVVTLWRWRQQDPLKHWFPTATLHGTTNQKTSTWIFTAMKTSSLSIFSWSYFQETQLLNRMLVAYSIIRYLNYSMLQVDYWNICIICDCWHWRMARDLPKKESIYKQYCIFPAFNHSTAVSCSLLRCKWSKIQDRNKGWRFGIICRPVHYWTSLEGKLYNASGECHKAG